MVLDAVSVNAKTFTYELIVVFLTDILVCFVPLFSTRNSFKNKLFLWIEIQYIFGFGLNQWKNEYLSCLIPICIMQYNFVPVKFQNHVSIFVDIYSIIGFLGRNTRCLSLLCEWRGDILRMDIYSIIGFLGKNTRCLSLICERRGDILRMGTCFFS